MATASEVIKIAVAEIGVKESPANSNRQKYGKEYGVNGVAWCCQFAWWVFKKAGAAALFYGGKKTAYCPTLMQYYKDQGQFVTKDFKPGDIIFFDFNGNGQPDHVGIVEKVVGDTIYTIEGNTSVGNDANGGQVMRRNRTKKNVLGVGRPNYDKELTTTVKVQSNTTIKDWQKAAIADGLKFPKYGADGQWGSECEEVAKKALCKKQIIGYKNKNLTKIIQKAVGVTADGKFGNDTKKAVIAYQKKNGLTADGVVGYNTWKKILGI